MEQQDDVVEKTYPLSNLGRICYLYRLPSSNRSTFNLVCRAEVVNAPLAGVECVHSIAFLAHGYLVDDLWVPNVCRRQNAELSCLNLLHRLNVYRSH